MIKLIQLELKKSKISNYIKGAIIANIIILGILILITYPVKSLTDNVISNYLIMFSMIDTLVRATFMIFSSILISKIIIKDLKNEKAETVDRKNIMISKIIVISIFSFFTIIISNIFLDVSFHIIDNLLNLLSSKLSINIIITNITNIFLYSITSSIMILISVYAATITKSTPITIITSLILISITCSDNNGFSLNSITIIPVSLAILGIVCAYLSIKKIESIDI